MPQALIIKGQIGRTVEYTKGEVVQLAEGETLLALDTYEIAAASKATEKAAKDAREQLKALKEAFPDNPGLALEAFVSGKTAEQVKAESFDKTAKELEETKKKLKEAQNSPRFRASDDETEEEDDEDKPSEEDDDEDKTTEEDDDEEPSEEDDEETDKQAKKEWKRNSKIRGEFGSFKVFRAYKRAEKKKAFKLLKK